MKKDVAQQFSNQLISDDDIVVGHSMGGIISSDLRRDYDFRLITINSPSARRGYNVTAVDDPLMLLDFLHSDKKTLGGHSIKNSEFNEFIEMAE